MACLEELAWWIRPCLGELVHWRIPVCLELPGCPELPVCLELPCTSLSKANGPLQANGRAPSGRTSSKQTGSSKQPGILQAKAPPGKRKALSTPGLCKQKSSRLPGGSRFACKGPFCQELLVCLEDPVCLELLVCPCAVYNCVEKNLFHNGLEQNLGLPRKPKAKTIRATRKPKVKTIRTTRKPQVLTIRTMRKPKVMTIRATDQFCKTIPGEPY